MSLPWFLLSSAQRLIDALVAGEAFTYSVWTNEQVYERSKDRMLAAGWIEAGPGTSTVFLTKQSDVSNDDVLALLGGRGEYVFEPIESWMLCRQDAGHQ